MIRALGRGVNISSGAKFVGAVMALEKLDNKKYLRTDLIKEELFKDYFLSKDIDLIETKSVSRICLFCENSKIE